MAAKREHLLLRMAMALARKDTLAQWNALHDSESRQYLQDAERAPAAYERVQAAAPQS